MARPKRLSLLDRIRLPLATDRLVIRPPRRSDVPRLVPLVGDRRVARPTHIPHPYSDRLGYEFVRSMVRKRRKGTDLGLVILDKENGELIGGIGMHRIDWENRVFELGYWVAPAHWGQGIASEAAYAVCREGFRTLRMHRIEAGAYAYNRRSARVLRRVGFRPEGRFRESRRDGRRWVDALWFGLLADELRSPG